MRLTTAFYLSSILLATTGLCTLVMSVELSPLWLLASAVVVGMSMLRLLKWRSYNSSRSTRNTLLGTVIAITVFDYLWVSDGLIFVIIHFLVLFMYAMLLTIRSPRDFYSLYGISFLHLMAAAALTVSLIYAVGVLVYLLLGVWTLMLYHLMQSQYNASSDVEHVLTRRFAMVTNGIALGSFVVMLVLFAITPRIGAGFIKQQHKDPIAVSGFSETVELGEIGSVKLDPTIVMRVDLPERNAPIDNLYFRGVAFDSYDGRVWSNTRAERKDLPWGHHQWREPDSLGADNLLKQVILLEQINSSVLFGANKIQQIEGRFPSLHRDGMDSVFLRYPPPGRIQYTAFSAPVTPSEADRAMAEFSYPFGLARRVLQVPPLEERVAELARSIVVGQETVFQRVRAIESHLKTNFAYSLNPGESSTRRPVEEFLFQRKTGYCEHYATSMVMLLRSVGIASRLVTGFLSGEWNAYGKYYAVRQSDAHAWVEVYFPSSGWVTFDPTPTAGVPVGPGLAARVLSIVEALRHSWDRYVISYSIRDQVSAVMTATQMGRKALHDTRGMIAGWKNTVYATMLQATQNLQSLGQSIPGLSSSPLGLVVPLLFIMGLVGFVIWKWSPISRSSSGDPAVEAYEQMLQMLTKQGLIKKPQWTAFEFVRFIEEKAKNLAPIVKDITQTYCRARFGQQQWSIEQSHQIEHQLALLKPS